MPNRKETMGQREHIAFIFAHIAFFVVFVWFGLLKMVGLSPATELVHHLFSATFLPHLLSFDSFIVLFGAFEVLIGILFILPKTEKIALVLLVPHMFTTVLPLFLVPNDTWNDLFQPTIEGQYIIKNIVLIALAVAVFADLGKRYSRASK